MPLVNRPGVKDWKRSGGVGLLKSQRRGVSDWGARALVLGCFLCFLLLMTVVQLVLQFSAYV